MIPMKQIDITFTVQLKYASFESQWHILLVKLNATTTIMSMNTIETEKFM